MLETKWINTIGQKQRIAIQIGSGISFGITSGGNYGKGHGNGDETT